MARPAFQATPAHRQLVSELASFGLSQLQICRFVRNESDKPIDEKTLRKYFAEELNFGACEANLTVARCLYQKAVEDRDTGAMIFWLKTRAGWKTTDKVEVSGTNGEPITVRHQAAKEQFLESLARAVASATAAESHSTADSGDNRSA